MCLYKIRNKGNIIALEINEIFCIESYNRHLYLWTQENKYEFSGKLTDEEKKLSRYDFVICHQSFLVNIRHIKIISQNSLLLKNGKEIPISKRHKTNVKLKFNDYLTKTSL
jgi:DNA-binding LytR/AlgR family response regulator